MSVCNEKLGRGGSFPGKWVGRFIWDDGLAHPHHFFLMARKSFQLDELPASASLRITASDRYILYVNGLYLGRGPARGCPMWMSYDSYDVTKNLRPGKNVIAVLAYHYGCNNPYTRDARAGLFAQLELESGEGNLSIIGTDKTWRVQPCGGYEREKVGLIGNHLFSEMYDATVDPSDWQEVDFDDHYWKLAEVLSPVYWERGGPIWSYLESRQTPMMKEKEVHPARILATGEAENWNEQFLKPEQVRQRLTTEPHHPLQKATITQPEALLKSADGGAIFQSGTGLHGNRDPYVLFDFGRPYFGCPKIVLEAPAGAVVELIYGSALDGDRIAFSPHLHKTGDRYVCRAGEQTWQLFEARTFRYMLMVIRRKDSPVRVKSVGMVSFEYPVVRKGSFECSDPILNRFWHATVESAHMHMEDAFIIDPVRERRAYLVTGEAEYGHMAIYSAYGDQTVIERNFLLTDRGQMANGLLRMWFPGTDGCTDGPPDRNHAASTDNPPTLPQATLFYARAVWNRYMIVGAKESLRERYPVLARLARWFEEQEDERGLLSDLPYWNWLDWVDNEMRGANFETNALYCTMLDHMALIADALAMSVDAKKWRARAQALRLTLRETHWDAKKGLFSDSVIDGLQSPIVTELANSLAILFGIADEEQTPRIVEKITDPHSRLVRGSPLYFYYILEGLIQAGCFSEALAYLVKRYTPMMQASDFPTIWESWEGLSAVHCGGGGPLWVLTKYVLGIRPLEPGFKKCRIEPMVGHLQWAKGVFPSVLGAIGVDWKCEENRFLLRVQIPKGMEAEIVLPRTGNVPGHLLHNGKRMERTEEVIEVGPGNHELEIVQIREQLQEMA